MRFWVVMISGAAVATMASGIAAQRKPAPKAAPRAATQVVTGPKARYQMDVGTLSGLGGGMAGGGSKPDMGQMMRMAMGGGSSEFHELRLRLGSTLAPTGAPAADHYFIPAANMGASVPLVTPEPSAGERTDTPFERPKGRLLIFWGCGAHAPAGQPIIIDFAKLAAGQVPPDLFTARVPVDRGPTYTNSKTYGDWPNRKSGKMPQGGSLIGDHRVAGNYSPEIRFTLQQDYMAGLHVRSTPAADGSFGLNWNAVPTATGYYAWVMGSKNAGRRGNNDTGDIVWWSSSDSREFGGGLWDWISPSVVERLVGEHVIMPPSQTSCTVPAEVKQAAGETVFGTMFAYGPEANFVYPARPATGPWNQEWTARVRFRSMTSFLPGMPGMGNGGDSSATDQGSEPKPKKRCKGGLLGAVTKLGC